MLVRIRSPLGSEDCSLWAVKIVLLAPHFAPEFEGGTECVVRAQAQALMRRGHDVRVLSGSELPLGRAGEAAKALRRTDLDGLPVSFLSRTPEETYDLTLERPRLAQLLEQECRGADLVHLHHWSTLTGDLVRSLSAERPVVLTLHDLFVSCPRFFRVPHPAQSVCPARGWDVQSCVTCIEPDAPGMPREVLAAGLEARRSGFAAELRAAARVLVPSRAHHEALARYVELPASSSVMPHGLCFPLKRLEPLPIPARFGPDAPLRVLFLGHRSRVKGALDLVEALAGLAPEARECVRLILLGSEVQAGFDAELRERARGLSMELGAGYEVQRLGASLAALGGAHLAALPSQVSESYGLVTDEAMGLGLPVWVSDRGAPQERVGTSGKVLPAQDAGAWRSAFEQLLSQPDLLKEARGGLPICPRSVDNAAEDLEEIYRSLLSAS